MFECDWQIALKDVAQSRLFYDGRTGPTLPDHATAAHREVHRTGLG